jgi:hypothetical protein
MFISRRIQIYRAETRHGPAPSAAARSRASSEPGPEADGPDAGHCAGWRMGSTISSRDGAGRWLCLERHRAFAITGRRDCRAQSHSGVATLDPSARYARSSRSRVEAGLLPPCDVRRPASYLLTLPAAKNGSRFWSPLRPILECLCVRPQSPLGWIVGGLGENANTPGPFAARISARNPYRSGDSSV